MIQFLKEDLKESKLQKTREANTTLRPILKEPEIISLIRLNCSSKSYKQIIKCYNALAWLEMKIVSKTKEEIVVEDKFRKQYPLIINTPSCSCIFFKQMILPCEHILFLLIANEIEYSARSLPNQFILKDVKDETTTPEEKNKVKISYVETPRPKSRNQKFNHLKPFIQSIHDIVPRYG